MLLTIEVPCVSPATVLFDLLVSEGEEATRLKLSRALHHFLVGCLEENMSEPTLTHGVLAKEFLEATAKPAQQSARALKKVGDEALILAGFFPERARRLRVGPRYFQFVGQGAYASVSAHFMTSGRKFSGFLYGSAAAHFALLVRVLAGTRGTAAHEAAFQSFKERFLN